MGSMEERFVIASECFLVEVLYKTIVGLLVLTHHSNNIIFHPNQFTATKLPTRTSVSIANHYLPFLN
jgi:hypothetical protein